MKANTWKTILQIAISILTAIATTLGVNVGGDAFGDPDCFRMSYATSDENIKEAIRRIKEALSKLK